MAPQAVTIAYVTAALATAAGVLAAHWLAELACAWRADRLRPEAR